jgi:hypothetical protein
MRLALANLACVILLASRPISVVSPVWAQPNATTLSFEVAAIRPAELLTP